MAGDAKQRDDDQDKPQDGPTFDEVVRKMLNTPPKPKKGRQVEKKQDQAGRTPKR